MIVHPKRSLSQNYLQDKNIARKIAGALKAPDADRIYEIGPGHGILTGYLAERFEEKLNLIEIDSQSVESLKKQFPTLKDHILHEDFLKYPLWINPNENIALIGNVPYHITSSIFFKILEYRDNISEVVAMIQKEVAERLVSLPGSRRYGLLSVLLQTFYHIDYLFTVNECVFYPRPRVKSAVIRLVRNERDRLPCQVSFYFTMVKKAFNQRRKTLRNALKSELPEDLKTFDMLSMRAEQLSPADFISLCLKIEGSKH